MEAMYVGVPIVTTRVGAVEEFERAAGARLFWSVPEDPTAQEIAASLREALIARHSNQRSQMVWAFAESNLTAKCMTTQWDDLLTAAVSASQ
jgi:glycosyltransferase involved in cell wall biosynthesis